MRTAFVLLASLFLLPSLAFADDARRSITASGEATVYVAPDEAEISLGVTTYAAKLDDAKSDNDKSSTAILAGLKTAGVEEKNIRTDDVTVSMDYVDYQHGTIRGYYVRRVYAVKVLDLKLVSKVIDGALRNGANFLNGVTFNSTQLRKYRDQARKMAAKAAREKAADLAGEFDAAVGPVRTINESYLNSNPYRWWGYYGNSQFGNQTQNAVANVGGGEAGGDDTVQPGQIAIKASVTATFDLEDAR